jgi:hypothetical protein
VVAPTDDVLADDVVAPADVLQAEHYAESSKVARMSGRLIKASAMQA